MVVIDRASKEDSNAGIIVIVASGQNPNLKCRLRFNLELELDIRIRIVGVDFVESIDKRDRYLTLQLLPIDRAQ